MKFFKIYSQQRAFVRHLYRLACSNNYSVFELLYRPIEIEHLGHDNIHADGNLVTVVVKAIPQGAALLPHQFTFHQMTN